VDNVAENGQWFLLSHIDRMGNLQWQVEMYYKLLVSKIKSSNIKSNVKFITLFFLFQL
jgi:hypothetical protein